MWQHLELEFLLGCCRRFGAVTLVLVAALRDEVDWWSQAVDGQLVAVPELIITFCQSTWGGHTKQDNLVFKSTLGYSVFCDLCVSCPHHVAG